MMAPLCVRPAAAARVAALQVPSQATKPATVHARRVGHKRADEPVCEKTRQKRKNQHRYCGVKNRLTKRNDDHSSDG
jgi:hypothetical protein